MATAPVRSCSFPGCDRPHLARGLCMAHDGQRRRGMEVRPLGLGARRRVRPIQPHPSDPSLRLVTLTKGYVATISAEDAEAVGSFNWTAMERPNTVYGGRTIHRENGKRCTECLHQFIGRRMGLKVDPDVDHENGNGLDCRRNNLRAATHAQNLFNARKRRDNTSGVKGVCWVTRERKWKAYISVDSRHVSLGHYDSRDSAESAVRSERERRHGAFVNHGDSR